jgi:hypothetical protein
MLKEKVKKNSISNNLFIKIYKNLLNMFKIKNKVMD